MAVSANRLTLPRNWLAPVVTVLANSLLQGTVNALLTFRVGCIAKRYSSGMPLPDPKLVRKAATREAARMLGGVPQNLRGPSRRPFGMTGRESSRPSTRI
jgi:hypothetical protein